MSTKLFIVLFISFILATIIGTVSHEFGHYFVAKIFGYEATVHYASTSTATISGEDINARHSFLITLGGPFQTMLTGTFGLILLYKSRDSFLKTEKLSLKQWLIIFVTLFWLRQTANFMVWIFEFILRGEFLIEGDEFRLAEYLHLPVVSIAALSAVLGAYVLYLIVFKFIPKTQRFTFILAGMSGGVAGFLIWIVWFGKYIFP